MFDKPKLYILVIPIILFMVNKLSRELRIMKSVLRVGLKKDVSDSNVARLLKTKGFITKSGLTSAKGKKALKLL